MKIGQLLNLIVILFLICGCNRERTVSEKLSSDIKVSGDSTAISLGDSNGIIKNPYRSGDYEFVESADVFRDRFNTYMQKSGWKMKLQSGVTINNNDFNVCTMILTDSISISAKLAKKNNAVVKLVLFGVHGWDTRSKLPLIRAMKGMVAAGPEYRYLTRDDIEVLLFHLGTLSDEKILPHGIWKQNGVHYEVKVELSKVFFGIDVH